MISVLILTFNEECNLPACLESVRWSDDILVLDSFSSDKTIEIAQAGGVRILQNPFVNFAEQRNFGIEHGGFKYEWVLHLDADETVPSELRDEITTAAQDSSKDAYRLASKLIFQNRWLRHSGMYPSYQVRLGKRDALRFIQVGHGQRENLPAEKLGTLKNALLHYSFSKGIADWIEKHNRYSTAEAQHFVNDLADQPLDWSGLFAKRDPMRKRRALKHLAFYLPFRPAIKFFYIYFIRLGFLDGIEGYHFARLHAVYEYLCVVKTAELKKQKVEKL
jgi:glycosyltransferase involved in cell wall biosynthesis